MLTSMANFSVQTNIVDLDQALFAVKANIVDPDQTAPWRAF